MQFLRTLISISLFFNFVYGCQKVELPVKEETGTTEEDIFNDEDFNEEDDFPAYYLSVKDAQQLFASDEGEPSLCIIRGYIVGYVKGNTIRNAVFSSDSAGTTNLLIADDVQEKDYTHCIPIELKKNSECREQLNLQEHPELLHARVLIFGNLEKYFGVAGLKDIEDFEIITDPNDQAPTDSVPGNNVDPLPEKDPTIPDSIQKPEELPAPGPIPEYDDSLRIDHHPIVIPGGRSITP